MIGEIGCFKAFNIDFCIVEAFNFTNSVNFSCWIVAASIVCDVGVDCDYNI
jgi:hypothetical protein